MAKQIGFDEPLASFLRVELAGAGAFRAELADFGWGKSLGGDVLARAVLAAWDRDDAKPLHALHASFLAPAPAGAELDLRVAALHEGRNVARRRVSVACSGADLCEATASFAAPGDGPSHQAVAMEEKLPAPETLRSDVELARAEGWPELYCSPIEWRRVGPSWPFERAAEGVPARWTGWFRPRVPLQAAPRVHSAALVLLSDYSSHWGVELRLGPDFPRYGYVSLDHAIWIHRPLPRWDDYWLMTTQCDVGHGGRALTRREIFARDGTLIASVAQEGLVTPSAG